MQPVDRPSAAGKFVSRIRTLRWSRIVFSVLLAYGIAGRTSYAQVPLIPVRGVEESGRVYIGEPVSNFVGHIAMLFVTGKHPTIGAGMMQDTVDWVNDPMHSSVADGTGGLAVYAHPDAASRVLLLHGLTGMEVFHNTELPSGSPYRDRMWDSVLTSLYSQGQPLIWGFAADDSHSTSSGSFNFARNVALVPSPDVFSLKAALRSGAFYITNGPAISAISVSGTALSVTASQSSTVLWLRAGQYNNGSAFTEATTPGAGEAVRIDAGVSTSTLDIATLGVPLSELHYVRAIVQTSSTKYAMTQPFRISGTGAISNPYPAGGTWIAGQSHNHDDGWIGSGSTPLSTYRSNYQSVGQQAPFETAYSYWETPFQALDTDGYPDVTSVTPGKVAFGAEAQIAVSGVNFVDGTSVQIGDYTLGNVVVSSATQLTGSVPASVPPGTYDVVVTGPDYRRGTAAGAVVVQETTADNTGWASYQTPNLPWNQATSIAAIDADVWVGTMQGAARYTQGAWTTYIPTGGQNVYSKGIYGIVADGSGGIWFSSVGLWFQNSAGTLPWSYARPTNGTTSERWGRAAFDSGGSLWVTSRWGEGLAIRSPSGTWTRWTSSANGLPLDDNQAIARDTQGNMWVGFSGGRGVWKWTGSSWQEVVMPAPLDRATYASAIVAGRDGDMWVAIAPMNIAYTAATSGVVRFRADGSTAIYQAPLLPQPRVTDVLAAQNGDTWFASRAGVARLDHFGEWRTFTAANSGLISDIVMAMAEDPSGRVWFATANGVSSYLPSGPSGTAPAAPTALSATAQSTSEIALGWTDNSTDETGFRVERSTDGANFTEIATVGPSTTSYVSSGLGQSTTYAYRIRAYNTYGMSDYSNVASATTLTPAPAPPAAPTSLSATATSTTEIALAWTDNSSTETGFRVERSSDGVTFNEIATVGANVTAYANGGLTASTLYAYRVRAYNGDGMSAYSNVASATTLTPAPAPTVPAGPTNLTGAATATQVTLRWTDNATNEDGFRVERALGNGAFVLLATLGPNATSYVDSGLQPKTLYRYRVQAYNTVGTSTYSNTVNVKTKPK